MRRSSVLIVGTLLLAACSQKTLGEGALFDMAVSERITAKGLGAQVEVVRDTYGVPHIYGKSEADVAFAQGYIHAKDRLFQMIIQRAAATGELAILLGGSMVADDIQARMFRYYKVAESIYRGGDMTAEETKFMESYAKGVNAYLQSMKSEDMPLEFLAQGISDPKLLYGSLLNARDGEPGWSPLDSLAFARLMTFLLSFDNEGSDGNRFNAILKSITTKLTERGDDRASVTALGYLNDLYTTHPLRNAIVGNPGSYEKVEKTAARSSAARRSTRSVERLAPAPLPVADFSGLDSYISNLRKLTGLNPTSNNWVVRGVKTSSGNPMLANDPHLSLQQPSVFHESHLNTEEQGGNLNVAGVMFPLAPGIAIGFNRNIAWGETVVGYDVTDFYVETFSKTDGLPDQWTVKIQGADRPLKGSKDTLIFAPGSSPEGKCALSKSVTSRLDEMLVTYDPPTYEVALSRCVLSNYTTYEVEGHGPVVRVVRDEKGTPTSLVTVRWTGFDPTFELRAFKGYLTARSIDDFEAAVKDFKVGAQNQVVIDSNDNIGWFPNARVPDRDSAKCPPPYYLPQSGDGSCDWKGIIDESKLPKLRNPEKGYVATANNQPASDKALGSFYDVGYRGARITERLETTLREKGKISLEDMKRIQGDTYLLLCDDFRDILNNAIRGQQAQAGAAGSDAARYLEGWKCSSPSGYSYDSGSGSLEVSSDRETLDNSIATSVFHSWISNFAHLTFDDQLGGETFGSQQYARALYHISFRKKCEGMDAADGKACQNTGDVKTGESVFWDDWSTPEVETRDSIALRAYVEAIQGLTVKFGTADVNEWLWGKLHTLTVRHLADNEDAEGDSAEMFSIPSPADSLFAKLDAKLPGFPRPGGQFVVDASDPGLDLMTSKQQSKYAYGSGPSYRIVVEMTPDGPEAYTALPGGNVAHPRSRFYSNQLREFWWANKYKKFPFTRAEVRAAAAELLVFEPAGGK